MKTAINLLPPAYRRQRLIVRRSLQWSVVLLVILSSIGLAGWYKRRECRLLQEQVAAATRVNQPARTMLQDITAMRSQINELDQYQLIAEELEQQRQVLALLGAVSQAASRTAGKLRVVDCHAVNLQATETAGDANANAAQLGSVTLAGVALDSPTVAEFLEGLTRSGRFSEVKLVRSKERGQSSPELFDYEILCEL